MAAPDLCHTLGDSRWTIRVVGCAKNKVCPFWIFCLGRPQPRLRQPQTTWQMLRKRRPGRARTSGKSSVSSCISTPSEADRFEINLTRRLRTVLPVSLRTFRKPSAPTDPGTPLGTTRPWPGRESGTTRGVRLRRKSAYIARVAGRGVAGATATSICTADLTLLIL